jgi:hypothetical protein
VARAFGVPLAKWWETHADRISQPLWTGVLAAIIAWCLYVFGPPGGDAAAHLYQTQLVSQHGFQLWDNLWYSGRYSLVNYSLIYYPLAVAVGPAVVVAGSVGVAAAAFARLVRKQWPTLATGPAITAVLILPLEVIAGVYPFLLGLALGLVTLVALQAGRPRLAIGLAVLTIAAHPLAFGFMGMVIVAWALADRSWVHDRGYRVFAAALVVIGIVQLLLIRAFSLPGAHYIYDPKDFAAILAFCVAGAALAYRQPTQRPLWLFFWIYGAFSTVDFVIANPIGGNAVRLLMTFGLPVLLIPLGARGFQPRWAVVVCVVAVGVWQGVSPVTEWQASTAAQGAEASYWTPALAFLTAHNDPAYRVEVVQSKRYWEAYYIAGHGFAMPRGWYRQDDFPTNAVLYGNLTPQSYQAWLRATGVHYVLLSTDELDFTSLQEAALLRSGRSGLQTVAHTGAWTVYALADPTPIITPATSAHVTRMTTTGITIQVNKPGPLMIRVHDNPYWTAQAAGAAVCVALGTGQTTRLNVDRPGTVQLQFQVGLDSLVHALLGQRTSCATSRTP